MHRLFSIHRSLTDSAEASVSESSFFLINWADEPAAMHTVMHVGCRLSVTKCLRFWLSDEGCKGKSSDENPVRTENHIVERKPTYLRMCCIPPKVSQKENTMFCAMFFGTTSSALCQTIIQIKIWFFCLHFKKLYSENKSVMSRCYDTS